MANYQPRQRSGKPVKAPATIPSQIQKLKERGCIIENEELAKSTLEIINYYRLVTYFSVFLDENKRYRAGTTFNKTLRLYDFDRRLRQELMTALEDVEISLRAVISNFHALKYGALGYLNPETFDARHKHQMFLGKIDHLIEVNSDEKFVSHHINNYAGAFPLWVIMELFSFGTLAFFYIDMTDSDKKELAQKNYNLAPRYLDNWLLCMSELRNLCAHYNRLYGAKLENAPKAPPDMADRKLGCTLFDYVLVMKYLHKRPMIWNDVFLSSLCALFNEYADVIELDKIGFPENWYDSLFIKEAKNLCE